MLEPGVVGVVVPSVVVGIGFAAFDVDSAIVVVEGYIRVGSWRMSY